MALRNVIWIFLCYFLLIATQSAQSVRVKSALENSEVHRFVVDLTEDVNASHDRRKREHVLHKREVNDVNDKCQAKEDTYLKGVNASQFISSHTFFNESNYGMALAWVADNKGVIIVVTTEESLFGVNPSVVYISNDFGRSFANISGRVNNELIRRDNGLQKHPNDPTTVFLIAHAQQNSVLWRTIDSGKTFLRIQLPFTFLEQFVFHPTDSNKILARSFSNVLYISTDKGTNWNKLKENVLTYKWSTIETEEDAIYAVVDKTDPFNIFEVNNGLFKCDRLCVNCDSYCEKWSEIHKGIYTFGMQGKFLYASIFGKDDDGGRLMEVSIDGGKTWTEVQLPTITEDRFYSILDMTEGLIFMHVDNPGDTGHGILYTSDATGVIFSQSLTNHLYPNNLELTDFYKVQSMRGVYLASQLEDSDNSIHTVISFDRGGEWQNVQRPKGAPCKDETKSCFLQIHNMFSQSQGVRANPPLSVESAPGLILVHGHVAEALQTTLPDVFLSSDGGYSWSLILEGPHHYQIADQGGLLIAVPAHTQTPKIVKFSTDEGQCWHEYEFTVDDVVFTGLLTEPGNKAMSVAIWGYGVHDRIWRTFVIDFEILLNRECVDVDYEEWMPHESSNNDPQLKGCLLGKKEKFMKLKKEAWCKNGRSYEVFDGKKTENCACTKEDYECDYGFFRHLGSDLCVKDPGFRAPEIDICLRGHEEKVITEGYRKIPGDVCTGGFSPSGDKLIDLHEKCNEGSKEIVETELGKPKYKELITEEVKEAHRNTAIVVAAVVMVAVLAVILLAFIVRRYRLLQKTPIIRFISRNNSGGDVNVGYGRLQTENNFETEIEEALGTHTNLYEDESDEEDKIARGGGGAFTAEKYRNRSLTYGTTTAAVPDVTITGSSLPAPTHAPHNDAPKDGKPKQEVKSFHDDSDEDMLS